MKIRRILIFILIVLFLIILRALCLVILEPDITYPTPTNTERPYTATAMLEPTSTNTLEPTYTNTPILTFTSTPEPTFTYTSTPTEVPTYTSEPTSTVVVIDTVSKDKDEPIPKFCHKNPTKKWCLLNFWNKLRYVIFPIHK